VSNVSHGETVVSAANVDRAANVVSVASVLPATQTRQRKMLSKR